MANKKTPASRGCKKKVILRSIKKMKWIGRNSNP
jgi:hypothetical protein